MLSSIRPLTAVPIHRIKSLHLLQARRHRTHGAGALSARCLWLPSRAPPSTVAKQCQLPAGDATNAMDRTAGFQPPIHAKLFCLPLFLAPARAAMADLPTMMSGGAGDALTRCRKPCPALPCGSHHRRCAHGRRGRYPYSPLGWPRYGGDYSAVPANPLLCRTASRGGIHALGNF